MSRFIPLHRPYLGNQELQYLTQVIRTGNIAEGGSFTRGCCELLEKKFAIHKVLLTPSCTAALEMAALLCDLQPGHEVILPSFTFTSTANAFVRSGARPVFVDIRPDTLNLDENAIEAAVTGNTRAICPVHYAGVSCAMDRVMAIARRHKLVVIEDAAHALNASYQGRPLGSIGTFGAYSFHVTKNYTCGEGGALCINAPEMVDRAEFIYDKGTNRQQFSRGVVDKYTWVDIGSSFAISEIACAFLYAQLERLDMLSERRQSIWQFYFDHLVPLQEKGLLRLPAIPAECAANYHLFYVLVLDPGTRAGLIAHLRNHGIEAAFHYVPLHSSPMGRRFGYRPGDLPITEELSARLVRLPFYHDITVGEQEQVVEHLTAFLRTR